MVRLYILILLVGVSIVDMTLAVVDEEIAVVDEELADVADKDTCVVKNVALNKPAEMSSLYHKSYTADLAVDGNLEQWFFGNPRGRTPFCFLTRKTDSNWWYVDLGQNYILKKVILYNRKDCCMDRAKSIQVLVGENLDSMKKVGYVKKMGSKKSVSLKHKKGRFVKLVQTVREYLQLCEIKVLGLPEFCDIPNECKNGAIAHPDTSYELGYRCECPANKEYMFTGEKCEDAWIKVPSQLSKALSSSPNVESAYPIDQN